MLFHAKTSFPTYNPKTRHQISIYSEREIAIQARHNPNAPKYINNQILKIHSNPNLPHNTNRHEITQSLDPPKMSLCTALHCSIATSLSFSCCFNFASFGKYSFKKLSRLKSRFEESASRTASRRHMGHDRFCARWSLTRQRTQKT